MARIGGFLPRLVAVTVVWLLLTAALTYAAGQQLQTAPTAAPTPTDATAPVISVVVVPDVRGQAYVFAKGILEDAGFAWKVTGGVDGYAVNKVANQVPAPGTRVIDTGLPTIQLQLARSSYPQTGAPENLAPFTGTVLKLATDAPSEKIGGYKEAKPKVTAKPKPAAPKQVAAAKPKPVAPAEKDKTPAPRPLAFTFAGQRPEPQDELPLTERARKLGAWLAKHPEPTDRNVSYWLYQHSWIVSGAEEGWWHGAEALRLLIHDDRRANGVWGIGSRSEAVARAALAEVEARSH
jgi:hypothetical protein